MTMKMKPLRKKLPLKRFLPLYVMMVPGLVYLVINNYMPMPGLMMAFEKFKYTKGVWGSPWVGVKNFTFLVNSRDLSLLLRNTLLYNLAFIVLGTVLSIAVAILLNELRSKRMQQTFQTLILIPHLMSYVIIAYIVYALFGGEYGMINGSILRPLGIAPVSWYTEDKYWPYIITAVYLWKSFGYSSIIYYATIVGFDGALYEAALVDGAGEARERGGLEERLAAAERDARENRVFCHLLEDGGCIDSASAFHRLRLGILAAGAAARAALHEDCQAAAVAVDDTVIDDAGDLELHQCRPCFTRSCSSARLASFQRSMVPTR